ncbi:MAG: opacity family porin [Comamonadaceae bacterium]|nr:opacity family porin [Comamonadaceae bacterium]
MKNFSQLACAVLLSSALGFSANALADQGTGFYIQGDVGLGYLNVDDGEKFRVRDTFRNVKKAYKESGAMPRLSAGYDYGDLRVAADYTHYKNLTDKARVDGVDLSATLKAKSAGLSMIYDVPMQSQLQPYVGARVAANKLHYSASANTGTATYRASESKTKLGLGVMAGVGYALNEQTTLDTGYRYNRLDSGVTAHEVSVGLRYSFK